MQSVADDFPSKECYDDYCTMLQGMSTCENLQHCFTPTEQACLGVFYEYICNEVIPSAADIAMCEGQNLDGDDGCDVFDQFSTFEEMCESCMYDGVHDMVNAYESCNAAAFAGEDQTPNDDDSDAADIQLAVYRQLLNALCAQQDDGEYCLDVLSDIIGVNIMTAPEGTTGRYDDCTCDTLDTCIGCEPFERLGCCYTSLSPFMDNYPCVNKHVFQTCAQDSYPCTTGAIVNSYFLRVTLAIDGDYDFLNETIADNWQQFVCEAVNDGTETYKTVYSDCAVEDFTETVTDDGTSAETTVVIFNNEDAADEAETAAGSSEFEATMSSNTGQSVTVTSVTKESVVVEEDAGVMVHGAIGVMAIMSVMMLMMA